MRSVAVVPLSSSVMIAALVLAAVPCQADGPLQYHTLTPCRLADTRQDGGPLQDQETRAFKVQGTPPCGVPVGATAVSVNVTAVTPNGNGFLTLFQYGITRPGVSNLNFRAGEPAIGNGAIVALADTSVHPNDLNVFARVAGPGNVHMVLDVTGYFQ